MSSSIFAYQLIESNLTTTLNNLVSTGQNGPSKSRRYIFFFYVGKDNTQLIGSHSFTKHNLLQYLCYFFLPKPPVLQDDDVPTPQPLNQNGWGYLVSILFAPRLELLHELPPEVVKCA